MDHGGTVLRDLLRDRHWQKYSTFCAEYDRAARSVSPDLAGSWPSRPQLQRWLSGSTKTLPYPDHCRVLEAMFPGRTAAELFQRSRSAPAAEKAVDSRPQDAPSGRTLDLTAAYSSRSAFLAAHPLADVFVGAGTVRVAGLSLNSMTQHLPDSALLASLREGTVYRCLFLDPEGDAIAQREVEEGHRPGHLRRLTELNIDVLREIRDRIPEVAGECLQLGTIDRTIRVNITLVDRRFCAFQSYLPEARGLESPTFVIEGRPGPLFGLYDRLFDSL